MKYIDVFNLTLNSISNINSYEKIDIFDSLNRVITKDILSLRALPPYNNSAMDGYCFKYEDINQKLKVKGKILAGDTKEYRINDLECYKIMTGAKIPLNCDCVAPKEICIVEEDGINITKKIDKYNAIRLRGEEIETNKTILFKGDRLNASKIALLASQGIDKIEVYKELKIAIISTGSELKEVYDDANDNELYNINGINIFMHLKELGINSNYIGVLPDNLEKSIEFFKDLKEYDVIITTGGVSSGDADFTKKALTLAGFEELFHGVDVKPGRPLLIGKINNSLILALPGNPLAAIMHLILLGIPSILKKQGANEIFFSTQKAKISSNLHLKPNRANIVLGELKDGIFTPYKNNQYGSGMITPLINSNAIVIFNEKISTVTKGDIVNCILFKSNQFTKNCNYFDVTI